MYISDIYRIFIGHNLAIIGLLLGDFGDWFKRGHKGDIKGTNGQ